MDQLNHHDYYIARAEAARALAYRAASPAIAAIHAEMADRYDATVAEIEQMSDDQENRCAQAA